MSVIFGKYHLNKSPLNNSCLENMRNHLNHWNADDIGLWKNNFMGLGHLMLWNTPESHHEKLPYQSPYSGNIITADARIDNREELFSKLKISDISTPDSTLILAAYDKYGRNCIHHLLGDFAFAIWDKHREELFCARDHIGVKPFFYTLRNQTFIFSSELKGILANTEYTFELNNDYFLNDFYQIINPKNITAYKNILSLNPAHYLIINKNQQLEQIRYWDLEVKPNNRKKNNQEYLKEFEYLFNEATKARLRSSYDISAQMSGGLDSSGVVAKVNELLKNSSLNLFTYSHALSAEFIQKIYPYEDERKWINLAIQALDLQHHEYIYNEHRDYLADIRKKNTFFSGPYVKTTVDMTMFTTEVASQKNSRTLFSGYFGDEFASFHWVSYWREYLRRRNYFQLLKYLNKKNTKRPWLNYLRLIKLILKYEFLPSDTYKYTHSTIKKIEGLFIKEKYANSEKVKLGLQRVVPKFYDSQSYQYFRLNLPGVNHRLVGENTVAQAYRMEMRYPLTDVRLVEYSFNLPFAQKYRNQQGRYLFRQMLKKYLPNHFATNAKIYIYTVPSLHPMYLNNYDKIIDCIENFVKSKRLEYVDFDKVIDFYKKSLDIENHPNTPHALRQNHLLLALILFLNDYPNISVPKL